MWVSPHYKYEDCVPLRYHTASLGDQFMTFYRTQLPCDAALCNRRSDFSDTLLWKPAVLVGLQNPSSIYFWFPLLHIYYKVINLFTDLALELIYLLRLTAFTRHTNLPNWNSKTLTPRLFSHMHVYISSPLKLQTQERLWKNTDSESVTVQLRMLLLL
jgi:hypothetical protein